MRAMGPETPFVVMLAQQEIRWRKKHTMKIGNTTIFFGQCDNLRQEGSGFAVEKNVVPTIRDFQGMVL